MKPRRSISDSRSAVYSKKRIGPNTDPCGTPHMIKAAAEVEELVRSPIITDCRLSEARHISADEMYSTICVEWVADHFGLGLR